MRRFLPFAAAVGLIAYGCAAGSADTQGGPPGGPDASVDSGRVDAATPPISHDSGAADTGPVQTCTHNDDCMAANLCEGSNGLACKGGICVPTGMPMNCDDGIACTDDSCDATTNECVHTPDDTNCPNGSYCDPTLNCVQTLPCTPGDSVCDRLNTNACDGLWTCDPTAMHCVLGAKPCQDVPNATTQCAAAAAGDGGATTACSWTCDSGYVHLVNQNGGWSQQTMLSPPPPAGGCECHETGTDVPDYPGFVDANCDGIDGTIANAVFVDALTGSDSNPGTLSSPKKSIQAGVNTAGAASPTKDVYVSKGTYNEHVNLVNGVSLYGGYDASKAWQRSLANVTLVSSPTNVGIDAQNLQAAFNIQFVTLESQAATSFASNGGGDSSYGVRLVNDGGGATVEGCTITAGAGNNAPVNNRPNGSTGAYGGPGGPANGETPGNEGSSSCGAPGGEGGAGVSNINGGNQGNAGTTVSGGGQGASGGAGGGAGYCNLTSAGNGGNAPPVAQNGGDGSPGTNAGVGPALGTFDSSGNYEPAFGLASLSSGTPGGGGGGGGSGGGTQYGCGFLNTSCCGADSGGGGGGGGGGCGGTPGGGGYGGGGSFAIIATGTSLTTSANHLSTGLGGTGGPGGNGGSGGGGGGGGGGGQNTNGGDHSAGNGAAGSTGGSGGIGGAGSGGPGGPSACIAYAGTSPTSSGDVCSNAGGGQGGAGGSNGLSPAASGPIGATGTVDVP